MDEQAVKDSWRTDEDSQDSMKLVRMQGGSLIAALRSRWLVGEESK